MMLQHARTPNHLAAKQLQWSGQRPHDSHPRRTGHLSAHALHLKVGACAINSLQSSQVLHLFGGRKCVTPIGSW